jgi:hypothetical protein
MKVGAVVNLYWDVDTRRVMYSDFYPRERHHKFLEQMVLTWLPENERQECVEKRCEELQALIDKPAELLRKVLDIELRLQSLEER